MSSSLPFLQLWIGKEIFSARLRRDLAPASCAHIEGLLPYQGKIIHARWSGEALWSPLAAIWQPGLILPAEEATASPAPGQVLLFAGARSEPELLLAYGTSRFASRAGPLAGNPVLTIEDRLAKLAEIGHEVLWQGAMDLHIERATRLPHDSLCSVAPSGERAG